MKDSRLILRFLPPGRALTRFFAFSLTALALINCSVSGRLDPEDKQVFNYTVKRGDTLSGIANLYGTSVGELAQLNGISDPALLSIGQILQIKGSSLMMASLGRGNQSRLTARDSSDVILPSPQALGISFRSPVKNWKLVSSFDYRADNFHEGLDLLAAEGEPIMAAHEGQVVFSGQRLSGYGNLIAIKGKDFMTLYAHNSENLVEVGEWVRAGQKIGLVGSTGRATGPHLHFELRVKGSNGLYYAVDPTPLLKL